MMCRKCAANIREKKRKQALLTTSEGEGEELDETPEEDDVRIWRREGGDRDGGGVL